MTAGLFDSWGIRSKHSRAKLLDSAAAVLVLNLLLRLYYCQQTCCIVQWLVQLIYSS